MSATQEVVVAGAVRTPLGRFGGGLASVSAPELGAVAVAAALERARLVPGDVDLTIMGNARPAGVGPNPARQIAHRAGIPDTTTAYTVNMACGSGLRALMNARQSILTGEARIVVAGGAESMSRVPYLLEGARFGVKMGDQKVVDAMYRDGFFCPLCQQLMGETAESLADRYGIGRAEQDEYAAQSQQRCEAARKEGRFRDEIVPVTVKGARGETVVSQDEHPRDGVTAASLATLPPVFRKNGTVHAGSSSGLVDGASAIVVLTRAEADRRGVPVMARIVDATSGGVDPAVMGIGPVPAMRALFERQQIGVADVDLIELNEAFAAQVIACERDLKLDRSRLNVLGGAIAIGHPIGATGARITTTLLHEMARRGARRGIATLCISGGQGLAVLFERDAA